MLKERKLDLLFRKEREAMPKAICDIPFGEVFWMWTQAAREQIHPSSNLSEAAKFCLEKFLIKNLNVWCSRCMVLEMALDKFKNPSNTGNSREEYRSFIKRKFFDQEELRSFFEEYKVLAETVKQSLFFWTEGFNEFLVRLDRDLHALEEKFHGGLPLGQIVEVQTGIGDLHLGNRTGYILHFSSGKKIVYKPRSLANGKIFNEILDECNRAGLKFKLKSYKMLNRGEYGWEEFIEHSPCTTRKHVQDYYLRSGMLLCLIYLLKGNDIHLENLIASGEYPVIIDTETLFVPTTLFSKQNSLVQKTVLDSVLGTGFLPCFETRIGWEKGVDMSCLGAEASVKQPTYVWNYINTSRMKLVQKFKNSRISQHAVFLKGRHIRPEEYVEKIIQGFREMYHFILKDKTLLLNHLEEFAKHSSRVIFRGTNVYAGLLQNLRSAKAVLNKNEREAILEKLIHYHFDAPAPSFQYIIQEEIQAINRNDIPYFHIYPRDTGVYIKDKLIVAEAMDKAPYQEVVEKIQNMSQKECANQEIFIERAFRVKQTGVSRKTKKKGKKPEDIKSPWECIYAIAKDLIEQGIQQEDGSLSWIHLDLNSETEQYNLAPLDNTLLTGKGGIAIFLAALARISNEKKWEEYALNVLKDWQNLWKTSEKEKYLILHNLGGMAGWGGIIYSFLTVGRLLKLPHLVQQAVEFSYAISPEKIGKDRYYDIVAGAAGFLTVLLSLYEEVQDPHLLHLAVLSGEHLCSKAVLIEEKGLAWKHPSGKIYTGFSHGTSGIAYALLRLWNTQKNDVFLETAKKAWSFEDALFCKVSENWPSMYGLGKKEFACRWCHGATGIGLGRLASRSFLAATPDDPKIQSAIRTTEKNLENNPNYTLCCGRLGQIEFLKECQARGFSHSLNNLDRYIPTSKSQDEHEKLGLMQGKAGLGYSLLKQFDKERALPQVLLFE